ncbi:hypothetical protein ALC57_16319, partial [Trachymyrmex cornetzi]
QGDNGAYGMRLKNVSGSSSASAHHAWMMHSPLKGAKSLNRGMAKERRKTGGRCRTRFPDATFVSNVCNIHRCIKTPKCSAKHNIFRVSHLNGPKMDGSARNIKPRNVRCSQQKRIVFIRMLSIQ